MEHEMDTVCLEGIAQVRVYFRWSPHPVIVTLQDNRGYIRVLLYS